MNLDDSSVTPVVEGTVLFWTPVPQRWYRRWWSKLLWHTVNKHRFVDLGYVDD